MILSGFLPKDVTTYYIISQVIGVFAVIAVCVGYFLKSRQQFFVSMIVANLFITISYFFLGIYFACIGVAIALIRTVCFYYYEKRKKDMPWWLIGLFSTLIIVNCAVFWSGFWDLLPMTSLVAYTIAFRIKKEFIMKAILFYSCFLFAIFDFVKYDYVGLVLKTIEITAVAIVLTKLLFQKNNQRTQKLIV